MTWFCDSSLYLSQAGGLQIPFPSFSTGAQLQIHPHTNSQTEGGHAQRGVAFVRNSTLSLSNPTGAQQSTSSLLLHDALIESGDILKDQKLILSVSDFWANVNVPVIFIGVGLLRQILQEDVANLFQLSLAVLIVLLSGRHMQPIVWSKVGFEFSIRHLI